jgi:hypothetical protein
MSGRIRSKPSSVEASTCSTRSSTACSILTGRLDDRELVDAVFRGLHTLKGSGAMFGFDGARDLHASLRNRLRSRAQGSSPPRRSELVSPSCWRPATTCSLLIDGDRRPGHRRRASSRAFRLRSKRRRRCPARMPRPLATGG